MPKVSQEHELRRREQILAAALACFAQQGYRETTMEDIVRVSGLSVGAIYSYYGSKEELFLALADAKIDQALSRLAEAVASPGTLAERLDRASDYFFESLETEFRPHARIFLEFWSQAPKVELLQARQRERNCRLRDFVEGLIRLAMEAGEYRADLDPTATAELLIATADGLVLHCITGATDLDLPRLKAALVSVFSRGLAGH